MFRWIRTSLAIGLVFTGLQSAACEETIVRRSDGKLLIPLKDVTIAVAPEDPQRRNARFYVGVPVIGTEVPGFTITDVIADPDRYLPKLRSSTYSSFDAVPSAPHQLLGQEVTEGTIGVGVQLGVLAFCKDLKAGWERYRVAAINLPIDDNGWTRQDDRRSPETITFIKFLDEGDRSHSRYYVVNCGVHCTVATARCGNNLNFRATFYSRPLSSRLFDQQIASAITVLEQLVVGKSIDFSQP